MSPDAATRPGLEPTASLTSVRVKRRRLAPATAGKRGDLTAEAEPEVIMTPEVIFAPPPAREPELALQPELLLLPPAPEPPPASEPMLAELLPAMEIEPAPQPEPEPEPEAAAETEVEANAETEAEPEVDGLDILDYWDSLRGARNVPALDALDHAHVAAIWPNTLLLAVEPSELPRITRLGENNGEIEYTGMVIDWIMTRGRQSARHAEPMEEEQRFAISSGSARYRLLLLPMGSDGPGCSHVLCQLVRLEERGAVASFRRWFTG
jgi:hypothetical protein